MSTLKVNAIEPYSGGTVTITGATIASASYATVAENLTSGDKNHYGVIKETFAAPAGGQTDIFTVTGAVTEGTSYPTYTVGLQDYGGPDFGDAFVTEIFGPGFAFGTGHSVSGKGLFVNVAPNGGGTAGKLRIEDAGGATSKATIQATNVDITGSIGTSGAFSVNGGSLLINGGNSVIQNNSGTGGGAVGYQINPQFFSEYYGATTIWNEAAGTSQITLAETTNTSLLLNTWSGSYDNSLKIELTSAGAVFSDWDGGYTDTPWMTVAPQGSVNIKRALKLEPQATLPAGAIGELAVSGSNLYFYNGAWTQVI